MKSTILFRDDGFSQMDEFLELLDQGLEFGVAWIGFQRGFDGLKLVRVLACGGQMESTGADLKLVFFKISGRHS
jgi:hypothetical protein